MLESMMPDKEALMERDSYYNDKLLSLSRFGYSNIKKLFSTISYYHDQIRLLPIERD